MDPLLVASLPLLGVVLTVVAGLLGAYIQRRSETSRWLREERLRAYTEHLLATDRMMGILVRKDPHEEIDHAHLTEVRQSIAICQLLGPDSLYRRAAQFQDSVYVAGNYRGESSAPDSDRVEARRVFVLEARKALGVKFR